MSSQARNRFAILMGDIVDSEAAPSLARVHSAFNEAIGWASERHRAHILSPLTITLGDEFQGLFDSLEHALLAASDLRFKLMHGGVACRFVIGVAQLETPVNPERAWNMMGAGLAAAREKLNDKKSPNAHRFSFPDDPAFEVLTDAVGDTLTRIEAGWSDPQRAYFLRHRWLEESVAEIATNLGITGSAVYKVLSAAQIQYYDRQMSALRRALSLQDKRYGFA